MDPEVTNTVPVKIKKIDKIKNKTRNFFSSKKNVGLLVLIVVLFTGGMAVYYKNNNSLPLVSNNVLGVNESGEIKNEEIVKKVGELTIVPPAEKPEFATIADVTKLDAQPFFANAQNGDVVIIYRTAKRVILYRPSVNKVIETGPLSEPTPTP